MEEVKEKTDFNYYTRDELISFLNILKNGNSVKPYTLFQLLAFSGLRQGESLALTWNSISFKVWL